MNLFFSTCFKNRNKILFTTILLISFICIFLLNFNTPLTGDDFDYSFVYQTDRFVENIGDIIESQVIHYHIWGGRNVVHFLVQLFILIGKNIFNVLNSFAFVALTFVTYLHCTGTLKWHPKLLLIINLLLWFCEPVFGETILWLTGSCNYLWGLLLILTFLLPFRMHLFKEKTAESLKTSSNLRKILFAIGMFFFGILAGWTNENNSIAMIGMIFLFMLLIKVEKRKLPSWSISRIFRFHYWICNYDCCSRKLFKK